MLFDIYGDPDGQDYFGTIAAATLEEAQEMGARIFGAPVIAVAPGDPPPHLLPFDPPFRAVADAGRRAR